MNEMRKFMESILRLDEGRITNVEYFGPVRVSFYDDRDVILEVNGSTFTMDIGDWKNFVDDIKAEA